MANKTGLPGTAAPWARDVESRLGKLERQAGITADTLNGMQAVVDKSVHAEFVVSQNFANGVNGKVPMDAPCQVQFVSSTGLFEVTVSLSGLVLGGAWLGVSFESDEYPSNIYQGIPQYGVVGASAKADLTYAPFSSSKTTMFSNRPGVYKFSLYAAANTTVTASAQAYINDAQLSVKAV